MDIIRVDQITKTYRLGVGRARVREMIPPPLDRLPSKLFPRWWARDTFNALDDVTLAVPAGSSIGLVGHNGAGKTTMLKVMAGVTAPTSGRVRVVGRMAALIDVLVGFHPDLTGRENAFMLGAVFGFDRKAMKSRIAEIFEFAEIQEAAADTPVKRFSAGMTARLGFGTLSALDIETLLIDEVLAVGDAAFQRKCIKWLDEHRNKGGSLVFISHNLGLVRSMTERTVWLDHGKVVDDGPTAEILDRYAKAMERRGGDHMSHRMGKAKKAARAEGMNRWGAGGARVEELHFEEPTDDTIWKVAISYSASDLDRAIFCIGFFDEGGREVGGSISSPLPMKRGMGAVECTINPLPLRSGIYFPIVALLSPDGVVQDRWKLDRAVVINRNGRVGLAADLGPVEIPAAWSAD